jgi:hypothetical protein
MANAFDIVRVTISRGWRGSSVSADGVPSRANSAYASSTTTMPGAASRIASTVSSGWAVPVGLLGEVTNTTSGRCSSIAATALPGSSEKSSSREARIHSVPVPVVMIGCIEYEGSNPSASRPGPPNACRICWRISLEPLAAHTCSVVSPWPR